MVNYEKAPKPHPTPPRAAPSGGPVNLSKVTLTKQDPTVSLTKQGSALGQMRVNLNWNANSGPSGGLRGMFGGSNSLDLDLGCLWELNSGDKGVVQALGRQFGSVHAPPYVSLDGDDRSGANAAGETLTINLAHLSEIKRILVFAYIYEGAPSWDKAQGVVTLMPASGPPVEIKLDENANGARFCAIALIQNQCGDLTVRREVRYIKGDQSTVDAAYGWGMRWTAGRK